MVLSKDAIFEGRTSGVVIGVFVGLWFIGIGAWFYRWGLRVKAMTPEERANHPWAGGLMGFSAVGYSLRHPWMAFAQAYIGLGVGSACLIGLPILALR